jgi:hypothetical protein
MKNRSPSTSGCSRELVSPWFVFKGSQWNKSRERYTKVNSLHITVTYLTATINRKPRKWELEIRSGGSTHTRETLRVGGYWYGFSPSSSSGLGFWTGLELNQTVFIVQTWTVWGLPGSVANASTNTWSFDCLIRLKHLWTLCGCCISAISCHCPWGYRRNIPCLFVSSCYQLFVYWCLRSNATEISQYARPTIIDAPLILIIKMGLAWRVTFWFTYNGSQFFNYV